MKFTTPINKNFVRSILLSSLTKFSCILLVSLAFTNCTNISALPSPVYSPALTTAGTLNIDSVADANKTIVKTGSLNLKVKDIRETGEKIEKIVSQANGYMTSMNERDDKTKHAQYEIRIPAQHLGNTMEHIAELGKVNFRRIYVTDKSEQVIQQSVRLNTLKSRKTRLKALYHKATKTSDKLEIEKTLSQIEAEIFQIEETIKTLQKTALYSKLSVSIKRAKIRGPLGLAKDSSSWSIKKLFTIRE